MTPDTNGAEQVDYHCTQRWSCLPILLAVVAFWACMAGGLWLVLR